MANPAGESYDGALRLDFEAIGVIHILTAGQRPISRRTGPVWCR
jgi:hypothetical protein